MNLLKKKLISFVIVSFILLHVLPAGPIFAQSSSTVYSKIRFCYKTQYSADAYTGDGFKVYIDGSQENGASGTLIAQTGVIATGISTEGTWEDSQFTVSQWFDFNQVVQGEHTITLLWGYEIKLDYFELATSDYDESSNGSILRIEAENYSGIYNTTNPEAETPIQAGGTGNIVTYTQSGTYAIYPDSGAIDFGTIATTVDKSQLEAKILEAEALNEKDYTPESWAALTQALEEARAVLNNEGASQEEVNTAVSKLESAIGGLVESLLNEAIKSATPIDSTPGRSLDAIRQQVNNLFDGNPGSISDFRTASGGGGGWVAFDFGEERRVQLTQVKLLPRQDNYYGRISGVVIQGTRDIDNEPWDTLTDPAINTRDWQTLTVNNQRAYRYIRIYNSGNWYGNLAEVKFYGTVMDIETVPIVTVSISSNNPENPAVAMPGDTVTLSFRAAGEISNVRVYINGEEVTVASDNGVDWTAQYTIGEDYTVEEIKFAILYDYGPKVTSTTDGTSVLVIDPLEVALEEAENLVAEDYTRLSYYLFSKELERIKEEMNTPGYKETELVMGIYEAKKLLVSIDTILGKIQIEPSMVRASTASWDGKDDAAGNGWRAFDGNLSTATDTTQNPSWIEVDLGEGNEKVIDSVRFYPRENNVNRINNSKIQGSNDGVNYVDLYIISGISTLEWHTISISDETAYRYIRHYFPSGSGNVAELEFYEKVEDKNDKTLLAYFVEKAQSINLEGYTQESAAALQTALSAAEAILSDPSVSQEDVDVATSNLKEAIEGLEKESSLPADLNGDGAVTIGDLGIAAGNYGKDSNSVDWDSVKNADINADNKIDMDDLVSIAEIIINN